MRAILALIQLSLLTACLTPSPTPAPLQAPPEGPSGYTPKPGWLTRRSAVATANPWATEAGYRMLQAGGSAVDAAIAAQMVLTLVEPQSSGIGGGAFLLHHDGRQVEAFDGRETAPAGVTERWFLRSDGQPMSFVESVVGGRAVGVPGTVRMLEMAHRAHGKLPWAQLMQPAITLAEQGFVVSPRFHALLAAEQHLRQDPVAAAYFLDPQGQPWPVGHLLKNPPLAEVLRQLARQGSKALHEGPLAQAVVDKVQHHPTRPGVLSMADLAAYQPRKRDALCIDHVARGQRYRVCGFPPPSSGGIAIGQILGLLNHTGAETLAPASATASPSPEWLHLYTESARLAFADRALYVADPDFVSPPGGSWTSLLAPNYLAQRARRIGERSMKVSEPGVPGPLTVSQSPMPDQPERGTSHISVVDARGQAVSLTTTIEDGFGSRQMVHGFLLNNELTDFSMRPTDERGVLIANRIQPGKRPRSSMAPTLVFDGDTGELLMSMGSPGGSAIIHYNAKTLYATLHWGLTPQQAIDLPNFGSDNGPTLLEAGRFPASTVSALKGRGHDVRELDMTSGLQAIQKTPRGYASGTDPRREGWVMGED